VLAEKSKEPVFTTTSQTEPDAKSEVVVVTPEKKEIKLEEYRPAAAAPARVARNVPSPPVAAVAPEARVAESAPRRLPKTGSALPLVALLGIAALGGAAALRFARRQA
jgi:LPXTG-motif cell wall-anchored protein